MRLRNLHVSVKGLLVFVALVGMAMVIALQWLELEPLRPDVRKLRSELGWLLIDDPTRAQAIAVRNANLSLIRWRIYLPPNGQYKLVRFGGILPPRGKLSNQEWLDMLRKSQDGISSSEFGIQELESEFTLEASLVPSNGQWKFETHPGNGKSRYMFSGNWPADRLADSDVWEERQRVFTPGEPVLQLYLLNPVKTPIPGGGIQPNLPTESAEGIARWLEQRPPN